MSLLLLLASTSSTPAPASGVYTLPVSWVAQAVMPDGSVHTTTAATFTGDEISRVTYVAGQV